MNKFIGKCSKLINCRKLSNCRKINLKDIPSSLTTKHINAPSCRDCKFSVWSLTYQSKHHEHFELKCIKFPYKSQTLGSTIVYPNAFHCRIDDAMCGVDGRHYEPVFNPY